MYKVILFIGLLVSSLAGCKTEKQEDPSQVAKHYCICLGEQISSSKDSLIDIRNVALRNGATFFLNLSGLSIVKGKIYIVSLVELEQFTME